jgi:DNA-directed RNA polymerase subunit alpha
MISLPSQPKIIEKKDNSAVFEIAGLWPGYGVTIGNSLRRVLLSSLRGAAITQVKIRESSMSFQRFPEFWRTSLLFC